MEITMVNSTANFTVDLLRHGRSISNAQNRFSNIIEEPLSNSAYFELEKLKEILKHFKYRKIYSSPYKRCLDTARYICNNSNLTKIEVVDSIREMNMGPWNGMSSREIEKKYPEEWQIWKKAPDKLYLNHLESVAEVSERALSWFTNLIDEENGSSILVVTHAIIIRAILAHYKKISLSDFRKIRVPNLKIYRLQHFNREPVVWEMDPF